MTRDVPHLTISPLDHQGVAPGTIATAFQVAWETHSLVFRSASLRDRGATLEIEGVRKGGDGRKSGMLRLILLPGAGNVFSVGVTDPSRGEAPGDLLGVPTDIARTHAIEIAGREQPLSRGAYRLELANGFFAVVDHPWEKRRTGMASVQFPIQLRQPADPRVPIRTGFSMRLGIAGANCIRVLVDRERPGGPWRPDANN